MTLLFAEGSKTTELSDARLREIVRETLQKLETQRGAKFERAVIVPRTSRASTRTHCTALHCHYCYIGALVTNWLASSL